MARNCARFGACMLLAVAAVLTGCSTGSSSMVNAVSPTTTASISATSYDFGQNIVGNPETQTVVEVTNTGTNPLTLNPSIVGSTAGFTVVAAQSCGATLAAASSCPVVITYAPTTAGSQTATLNLGLANVPLPLAPGLVTLTGTSAVMTAGTVTPTANPQVALYTITPPFAGNVTVNFGTTTSYGKQTWSVATPSGGGPVSIEVAGMLGSTAYHMQAAVTLADGVTATDVDHTFTTGAVPLMGGPQFTGQQQPKLSATIPAGMTPQSGIEMITGVEGPAQGLYATDLSWKRDLDLSIQTIKCQIPEFRARRCFPTGILFLEFCANLHGAANGSSFASDTMHDSRDRSGRKYVRQVSIAQINTALAANGFAGSVLGYASTMTLPRYPTAMCLSGQHTKECGH